MVKTVVTHVSVDLDAVAAIWLIKRFVPGWEEAESVFVSAGLTLDNELVDKNPNIIHVDTGFGRFDHHQYNDYTSATKLVFEYLLKNNWINYQISTPLERMIHFVNEIDHFAEANYPDATADKYEFLFPQIIDGLKITLKDDGKVVEISIHILDAVFQLFKNKVKAEKDLQKALVFQSPWGKSVAIETNNEEALKLALKSGFSLAIRKSQDKGYVRIKTQPSKSLDLTSLYKKLKEADKKASWFLHISKNMLLNGSTKNPSSIPCSLTLKKLIAIVKGM
jgi:hypothetical protein